jgi:predicted acylesterase/phospholipase RssA
MNGIHYDFDGQTWSTVDKRSKWDTLVVGGGGFKGVQYLGALHYLFENGHLHDVKTLCGTSVGSIICLLWLCGHEPLDQYHLLPLSKIFKLSTSYPYVESLLPSVMPDYLDVDVTFMQLFKKTNKFFFVIAYNVTRNRQEVFSCVTTPEYSVIEAVLFSCALPLASLPRCRHTGDAYMDGGISNNLAVDVVDDFDLSRSVLALCLKSAAPTAVVDPGLKRVLEIMVSVPSRLLDVFRTQRAQKLDCLLELESEGGIDSVISLDVETKQKLFDRGYSMVSQTFQTMYK